MDTKSKQSTIINNLPDTQENEESALNGEEIPNVKKVDEFVLDGGSKRSCCCVLKKALQWKHQNPVKAVLIIASCTLFVFGITGFVIMHEVLGIKT